MIDTISIKLGTLLSDVVDNRGRNPKRYASSGYKVLDNYLISESRYPTTEEVKRYIDQETHDTFLRHYLKKEDICITLVGNGIGNVCMIPSNDWVTIQNCIGLRTNSKNDPYYLYYYLVYIKKYIKYLDRGSSQPSILQGDLLDLKVNIFESKQYQESVSGVLQSIDKKIELIQKILSLLEAQSKAIYEYWFVQFDFPNENGKPYKSSGGSMEPNDLLNADMPEGWELIKLENLLVFEKGTEPGADAYCNSRVNDSYVPFYRVGDIGERSNTFIDSKRSKLKQIQPSDVVVTFDGSVGKVGIGIKGAISGGLRHVYSKESGLSSAVVYQIFSDQRIQKTIKSYATGSVLLHAGNSIEHLVIPYNQNVYEEFQKIVEPIFESIVNYMVEINYLQDLRNTLLPLLMSGQVRVEQ